MRTVSVTLAAGESKPFNLLGNYFQLLETVAGVDVSFVRHASIFSTAENMEFGFFSKPSGGFDGLEIKSATAQTIKFVVGFGDGGYNRTTGSVSIIGQQASFAQSLNTVGAVSAPLVAARATRKTLLIQNRHATESIYLALDGTSATVAGGVQIAPDSVLVLDVINPSGAINAIANAANNSIVVVEGF